MIKLDADNIATVVITCAGCPFWSAIRLTMEDAHKCASDHERIAHPEANSARAAARKYRLRQSVKL